MQSVRQVALGQPTVGEEEIEALREVFASGSLCGAGPTCVAFEGEFAETTGTTHALATSNCGGSLHLALQVLGANFPGDEVIVADYTFPATGHSVVWTGATPRFADVRPDIGTIDVDAAAALVNERTVGIIAVDMVGQPADYDELASLAQRRRTLVARGRRLLGRRDLQGPSRRQPRRPGGVQLPRPQGHHRR